MSQDHVLLTGGAGFIGSHVAAELAMRNVVPVLLDNFANSRRSVIGRLERITGHPVICEEADILDADALAGVFARYPINAVVHFAALKAVGESLERPLDYFQTNVSGLIGLMQAMQNAGVFTLVFSSSATVYGDTARLPIPETAPLGYKNPYGFTKLACEQVIEQAEEADNRWAIGRLRYFNPVGAHPSCLIGEDPNDSPNNLMPYIAKVAAGELPEVRIFGDDYPTPDGTGVRDYIHVCDLADGHLKSLDVLHREGRGHVVNLGTGRGHSVKEVVDAYSRAVGRDLPWSIHPRRDGDVAANWADPACAMDLLGFQATRDLDDMCRSSWNWIQASAGRE
ncbi:MAG: UDP-glucose 4-epimerase GalE [Pseudomonadota bacterium]